MHFWQNVGFVCLAAALVQNIVVADRVQHVAWLLYKFGPEPGLLTAGSSMLTIFFGATGFFVILGMVATKHLCGMGTRICYWTNLSVRMSMAGALIWGAFVMSDFVTVVTR